MSSVFTEVESRMLDVLKDGGPHTRQELLACLNDDQAEVRNIYAHVSSIRKKLRVRGQDIVCEIRGYARFYRHVRLLASPYKQ